MRILLTKRNEMKYIAGFLVSLIVMIALSQTGMSQYLIGWISCMAYYIGMDIHTELNKTK